ncbi:phosphatases II [Phanerochaete sordida]|uniref:Phosphatases II n=1 Tax=Phanerochaete sordida TaxID=48140 RepID=A0A9P3GKY7_9APHY|nr:phosphatases II [Phanerochaete sordida]
MQAAPSPNQQFTPDQLRDLIQGPGEEWTYEMRRQCQEILPGLLLGPLQASKDLNTLQSLGVTHIVCIRDAKEAFSVRPRFPEQFKYLVLDVQDSEEQNLIRLFPEANQFIEQAILQGGRVLVHCNGGISLSPSFVVMYVMQRLQITWEDALHMVQNRRYCISPNGGFLTQIKEYESIYKASLAVRSFPPQQSNANTRRKRADDSDDEESARVDDRKRQLVDDDDDAMEM